MESLILQALASAITKVPELAILGFIVYTFVKYIRHRDAIIEKVIYESIHIMGEVKALLSKKNGVG